MKRTRRALVCSIAGLVAGLVQSRTAYGEPSRTPLLGIMINSNAEGSAGRRKALEGYLARQGFEAGKTLRIVYAYSGETADNAGGTPHLIARAAKELVAARPDAIYVDTTDRAKAVCAETRTIPVVFSVGADPVASGLVRSLSKPGGNATGSARFMEETLSKRIELARELLPNARRIAIVADYPSMKVAGFPAAFDAQARARGLENVPADTSRHGNDLRATLEALPRDIHALITIFPFMGHRQEPFRILDAFEAATRIPVIYEFPGAGAIAVGAHWEDSVRAALEIVARILRGARPADIPVHQAMRIMLTVNAARARAIGLAIPQSILVRADRVEKGEP